jgi:hypothetical protein
MLVHSRDSHWQGVIFLFRIFEIGKSEQRIQYTYPNHATILAHILKCVVLMTKYCTSVHKIDETTTSRIIVVIGFRP